MHGESRWLNGMNAHFCLPNARRADTHQGGTRAISLFRGHSGDSCFSHCHCMFFEFQDREPVVHVGRGQQCCGCHTGKQPGDRTK